MKEIKIIELNPANIELVDTLNVGFATYHLIKKAFEKGDKVRLIVVEEWIVAHVTDPADVFAGYDQADFDHLGMID